jgi:Flp pilus assembly pilin Flp
MRRRSERGATSTEYALLAALIALAAAAAVLAFGVSLGGAFQTLAETADNFLP